MKIVSNNNKSYQRSLDVAHQAESVGQQDVMTIHQRNQSISQGLQVVDTLLLVL